MTPIIIITAIILSALVVSVVILIKLHNAAYNHAIIIFAIAWRKKDRLEAEDFQHINDVDWSDMEDLEKTCYRLTDWGYKRILPKEKYELIEPFIDRKAAVKEYLECIKQRNHP